jgi:hypothetical protein
MSRKCKICTKKLGEERKVTLYTVVGAYNNVQQQQMFDKCKMNE